MIEIKETTKCRSCGFEIFWWTNPKTQKNTPLEKEVTTIVSLDEQYVKGHQNHFITCPQRDKWRKK